MALIIAGRLFIRPGMRDEFLQKSREAMFRARENPGCEDFSVSPDPIDPNRVNIFEKWQSRAALDRFRGSGPENDSFLLVESFELGEYEVKG